VGKKKYISVWEKKETRMDCSMIVHLLRGKELGFRNVLTGNVTTQCTQHEMLQTCENIIGCNKLFYDNVYSFLDTCHSAIHGSCKQKYREFFPCTREAECVSYCINKTYIFNIVKEYDDIYIEVKKYLYEAVRMTIDAKKIIPKLSVSLEDDGWEKLKEIRNWGALILETYNNIIVAVGWFTDSATRILKSKTTEDMWEGRRLKRSVWNNYYVSYSEEFEPLILPRAAFKDKL